MLIQNCLIANPALIAQGWKYDEIKELKTFQRIQLQDQSINAVKKKLNYLYGKERKN